MNQELTDKLTEIQTLFSEQEHTIQTLNDIVSRQDSEIRRMARDLKWLKRELMSLKEQIPDLVEGIVDEAPPHY